MEKPPRPASTKKLQTLKVLSRSDENQIIGGRLRSSWGGGAASYLSAADQSQHEGGVNVGPSSDEHRDDGAPNPMPERCVARGISKAIQLSER